MRQSKRENSTQLVYSSVRESILNLNLVPGTEISETDMALRFKLSRTPVREAFIALSKEGLVTVLPQKGSMISRIDFARIEQELFLRDALETSALKQFLKNHNASHLKELEECIELQSQAANARKFGKFHQYDNMFHKVFFNEQNLAWEALENMCGHYHRVRLLSIWLQDIIKDLLEEHKKLFRAVKKRDSVKALQLLDNHIHKLNTEEEMLLRLFPDYFVNSNEIPKPVDFGGLNVNI